MKRLLHFLNLPLRNACESYVQTYDCLTRTEQPFKHTWNIKSLFQSFLKLQQAIEGLNVYSDDDDE